MIPQNIPTVSYVIQPSLTYGVTEDGIRVIGTVDGIEALKQSVHFILHTDQNAYPIYSDRYGVDLKSLIGAPIGYALPELERRVRDGLLTDDRIIDVTDIKTKNNGAGELVATFNVRTVYGDFNSEVTVNV